MEFDFTITMSVIIGLIATLPQIVVAVINNQHQYKLKKIEFYTSSKQKALSDFNENAIKYCQSDLNDIRIDYEQSLNNLYIYFPKINDFFVKELNDARFYNQDKYFSVLRKTMKYLSSFIEE